MFLLLFIQMIIIFHLCVLHIYKILIRLILLLYNCLSIYVNANNMISSIKKDYCCLERFINHVKYYTVPSLSNIIITMYRPCFFIESGMLVLANSSQPMHQTTCQFIVSTLSINTYPYFIPFPPLRLSPFYHIFPVDDA